MKSTSQGEGESFPRLAFSGISKSFGAGRRGPKYLAASDISFEIGAGEIVSIVGPSGCGKSTILNMAAGLTRPTAGHIFYDDVPVRGVNPSVGYLTQSDNLLPWRTVERNVGLALEIRHISKSRRQPLIDEYLQRVGLDGFEDRYPSQLSGGMRKRAALARALIHNPETLLMDEPFGALDAQMKLVLQQDIVAIAERQHMTVLLITHDLNEAITLSDRVLVMSSRPGRIIHAEDIDIPRPRVITALQRSDHVKHAWEQIWPLIEVQVRGRPNEGRGNGNGAEREDGTRWAATGL